MKNTILLIFLLFLPFNSCEDLNLVRKEWIEPVTGMKLIYIKPGRFFMGTPPGEEGQRKMDYYHEVEIAHPFFIGKYEVTQGQWEKIMGANPSRFNLGKDYPVESINWYEAKRYIDSLNKYNPGEKLRLPTEAEWEYVCRAGTTSPFNTGGNLTTEQANYFGDIPYKNFSKGISRNKTMPVGSFPPNRWGVYDMHGNVWEWCEDWFCAYPKNYVKDHEGNCNSDLKVIRGGSWYFNAESARSARRYTHNPNDRGFSLGFRVVKEEK